MREHEVPTHVQAEDRVLLGFTFPQIVAITAVCALSYGAYRYAPVGPSEIRMAIAVLFGLAGIAMVVGKIGGRRLPLVAADLLKYRLGARVYAGPVAQLVRSEPPAPPQPVKSGPGPLRLMAKRSKRLLRRMRKKNRKDRDRRDGRMPFRPHTWFGKRRKRGERGQRPGHMAETLESRRRTPGRGGMAVLVAVLVAMAATVPQAVVFAQSPEDERWRDEIDFEIEEPVEGRRIFVEGLTVSGDRASVTLKAATDIEVRVRAFGGSEGTSLRFWGSATLAQGERIDYSLPLHGPVPSFTVSWEDTLNQAGAITVDHDRIPYPLPESEGELCTVRLKSLGWALGAVNGVVESECVESIEHPVELQTVAGHESVTQTALIDADVTQITGTVNAATGASSVSVAFVPDGETAFTLSVPTGEAIHAVSVDVRLEASLSVPIPPLTVLTHHPERAEEITETVSLYRPGASDSDSDSDTITVAHEDGTTTTHTVSAYAHAHVPATTIDKDVTITVVHPEHVKAEVVEREPVAASRDEPLNLASHVGSDDPHAALVVPEPEPEDPPADQTPAGGLRELFEGLGWEWPW
ncbi:MAG: hypothetical protein F4Y02_00020 [Chloroflexi bacterium]|nr:hypothetical protein [Chloroflexota bacterium]